MEKKESFEGFGVSREFGTAYFRVEIPRSPEKQVVIFENFGFKDSQSSEIKRAVINRSAWNKIANKVAKDFNSRLKKHDFPLGVWTEGNIKVERILGKELCVLAWAVEQVPNHPIDIEKAISRWKAFSPEARRWLFNMTASEGGLAEKIDSRWRTAIRIGIGNTEEKAVQGM